MVGAEQPAGQAGQAGHARGYGRGQAFWFGLPLGALTLGVLVLAVRYPARISPGTAILLGLALYVVVAFLAGYRYCSQRRHEGREGGWAGFRVGLVSAALFLLVILVYLIIAIIVDENTPPPSPPNRTFHSTTLDIIFGSVFFGIFVILTWIGALLSAAGGRLGGALAIWRAKRLQLQEQHL